MPGAVRRKGTPTRVPIVVRHPGSVRRTQAHMSANRWWLRGNTQARVTPGVSTDARSREDRTGNRRCVEEPVTWIVAGCISSFCLLLTAFLLYTLLYAAWCHKLTSIVLIAWTRGLFVVENGRKRS